jgi:hypothetical protein
LSISWRKRFRDAPHVAIASGFSLRYNMLSWLRPEGRLAGQNSHSERVGCRGGGSPPLGRWRKRRTQIKCGLYGGYFGLSYRRKFFSKTETAPKTNSRNFIPQCDFTRYYNRTSARSCKWTSVYQRRCRLLLEPVGRQWCHLSAKAAVEGRLVL